MSRDENLLKITKKLFGNQRFSPLDIDEWIKLILCSVSDNRGGIFSYHNLHSLYGVQKDSMVREFYGRCHSCYIDGMFVKWILRLAGYKADKMKRFTLMDDFEYLLKVIESKELSVFYLGATRKTVEMNKKNISKKFPDLRMQFHHGYFEDNDKVLRIINKAGPSLLFVGMGMPKQEHWIMKNIQNLNTGVIIQSGGTLDYLEGTQAKPPPWMSNNGLGWLYRLITNPKKLWKRYLIEPLSLVFPIIFFCINYRRNR